MTYSEKLKDPRWQKKRLKILERDSFKCHYCNDEKTQLQVHHLKYNGEPWESNDKYLITLCAHCHSSTEICNRTGIEIDTIVKLSKNNFITCLVKNRHGVLVVIFSGLEQLTSILIGNKTLDEINNLMNG